MEETTIGSIPGFLVGNAQDYIGGTGCTAILSPAGAVGGADVRGGAPGTRETDLLRPENMVEKIHAVSLAGGSAFGLDAASGVAAFLEEQAVGYETGFAKVPIVPSAILFDLNVGSSKIRPDKKMGYEAASSAWKNERLKEGNHGCGTGASVGKCLGPDFSMKSGLGCYAFQAGKIKVGAIMAVNALGDIINPSSNQPVAGVYDRVAKRFLHSEEQLIAKSVEKREKPFSGNTTIGVVLTNVSLTKAQAGKIASIAQDGIARTTRPSHTFMDGDTLFAMSSGQVEADVNTVAFLAVKTVEQAILRAVWQAEEAFGLPAAFRRHRQ